MARAAAPAVEHLTEEGLARRWALDVQTLRVRRRNGDDMPPHLPLTESATKGTIRYRLADVEAWEESRLVKPAAGLPQVTPTGKPPAMTIRTHSDHAAAGPVGHHYSPGAGFGTLQLGADRIDFESPDEVSAVIAELAILHMEMTGLLLPGQVSGDPVPA